ncbi:hypothetical protein J2T17_007108 [Paenibacillus mucilaginosus]|uniref:hypothetical protein n=1 Tax=Paenibacillus mucilaginosus TaxID=61624 RepID=UPI003D1E5BEF
MFDNVTAQECKQAGRFVRYMYVIPTGYNYYSLDEQIPMTFEEDLSRVPRDVSNRPLVVKTNRGLERALPAYEGIALRVDPVFGEVPAIYTYQGQRELIYRLGVHLAKEVADREGVRLFVLPEEEDAKGSPEFIQDYLEAERIRDNIRRQQPMEGWEF